MPQNQDHEATRDPVERLDDDPRQANEEGEPQVSGRSRGRLIDEEDVRDARTNPDASPDPDRANPDVGAAVPHRESGDKA
jgi:hypothetical protein